MNYAEHNYQETFQTHLHQCTPQYVQVVKLQWGPVGMTSCLNTPPRTDRIQETDRTGYTFHLLCLSPVPRQSPAAC